MLLLKYVIGRLLYFAGALVFPDKEMLPCDGNSDLGMSLDPYIFVPQHLFTPQPNLKRAFLILLSALRNSGNPIIQSNIYFFPSQVLLQFAHWGGGRPWECSSWDSHGIWEKSSQSRH